MQPSQLNGTNQYNQQRVGRTPVGQGDRSFDKGWYIQNHSSTGKSTAAGGDMTFPSDMGHLKKIWKVQVHPDQPDMDENQTVESTLQTPISNFDKTSRHKKKLLKPILTNSRNASKISSTASPPMISFEHSQSNMTAEDKVRRHHIQRDSIFSRQPQEPVLNHVQMECRRAKEIVTDTGLNKNYHQYQYRYR